VKTIVGIVGHGGADPGAVANGLREKDLNLTTALAFRDYLNKYYTDHRVILTRETDVRVSFNEQRNIVEKNGADLAVEIHYNSFGDPRANGFETFILDSSYVFDMTIKAQRKIHNSVMDYLDPLGIRDRGQKKSRHWHLVNTKAPVVLVEGGFLTSTNDSNVLRHTTVQESIGKAIGQGVANALKLPRKEDSGTWPTKPLPTLIRTVGVEHEGNRTNVVGFLAQDEAGRYVTLLPMLDIGELVDVEVTGHGDHIKIKS